MPKNTELKKNEKAKIKIMLSNGLKAFEIAKKIKRDARTIKKYINSTPRKIRKDKGVRRCVDKLDMRNLSRQVSKSPKSTSLNLFKRAGIKIPSRASRCKILNEISSNKSPIKIPLLKKIHKKKRVEWALKTNKMDLNNVFKI